jgi:hypothetical protein
LKVNGNLSDRKMIRIDLRTTPRHWKNCRFVMLRIPSIFFTLEPPLLNPLSFGRDVLDEGEFVQLICIVRKGDEPLTLRWALKGDDVSSQHGLSTTTLGTRTSMLTIQSVGYRHSGEYTCIANNKAGSTRQTATMKVNGNLSDRKMNRI